MSNNISFVGRLGNDPELKDVGSTQVLEFTVANNTGFGDKKTTNWFRCAYWGARAVSVQQYLSKGKQIFITGELTIRKYDKKDGSGEGYSHDINVNAIDFVSSGSDSGEGQSSAPASAPASPETDSDMPF